MAVVLTPRRRLGPRRCHDRQHAAPLGQASAARITPPFPTHVFVQGICNRIYVVLNVKSDHGVCHVSALRALRYVVCVCCAHGSQLAARGLHFSISLIQLHFACYVFVCVIMWALTCAYR